MFQVDCIVAIVQPTQAYTDWLNEQIEDGDITLDLLTEDSTALILPAYESVDEVEDYVREHYSDIYKNELADWDLDAEPSAPDISYETFCEFFDLKFHSMVFDMITGDMTGHQFSTGTLQ